MTQEMQMQGRAPTEPGSRPADHAASRRDAPRVDPSRETEPVTPDWSEDLNLSDHARKLINNDPALLSLLYDLDLLPEQLLSQVDKTPGLIKAYHRLYGVLYAYQAFRAPPPDES